MRVRISDFGFRNSDFGFLISDLRTYTEISEKAQRATE